MDKIEGLCGNGVTMDPFTAASLGVILEESGPSNQTREGWNQLMFAIYYHRKDVIINLIKDLRKGASVQCETFSDVARPGTTPLCLCVLCADLDTLKLLYSSDYPEERDSRGRTSLHLAVQTNQISIVQYLLEYGANPNLICQGLTCLGEASRQGNIELIKLLLEYKGNISVCGQVNTPLTLALESGNMAAVYILLTHITGNYKLEELFKQVHLEKYWHGFQQDNISYQQFTNMTEADLKKYGVRLAALLSCTSQPAFVLSVELRCVYGPVLLLYIVLF